MRLEDRQWAGLLLLVGTTQFAIGMIIAEAVDPSYSVSTNYISDLGVRAGAAVSTRRSFCSASRSSRRLGSSSGHSRTQSS